MHSAGPRDQPGNPKRPLVSTRSSGKEKQRSVFGGPVIEIMAGPAPREDKGVKHGEKEARRRRHS
ncbi:hypothetical protein TRICHSKD4_2076 [Roseibium sp. TrichSKD4]|nr:hypothetical protein TRICHSKD4_2076 [Roseibium sp. TrichSKD4]